MLDHALDCACQVDGAFIVALLQAIPINLQWWAVEPPEAIPHGDRAEPV